GFHGFVMTDWYASKRIETTENCINAGLSLEMPKNIRYTSKNLQIAYDKKKFSEEALDFVVKRLLRIMFLVGIFDDEKKLPQGSRNTPEHQKIARKIAEEGIVLLKNDDNILPLDASKIKKITILGPNAKKKTGKPLFGGSAAVVPPYEITPFVGLKKKCNKEKIEIVKDPADADVAILVLGLNHKFHNDSEGSDRKRLELPEKQVKLIKQTVTQNPNTIVVLINGSPIAMEDWIEKVPAILEAWYPGMEGGNAIADILFGNINPSGKLPITFPKKLSDSPAHKSERTFPGDGEKVFYDEGIYVGYRHFDKEHIDPLFPFGFGLSYTEFKYSNLRISKEKFSKNESTEVSVDIMNKGTRSGAEIVQLYIEDLESRIDRPPKELKGFKRIQLEPQEKKEMKFTLYPENFAFYDDSVHDWVVESGIFKILIGSSSRDIKLQKKMEYLE
ncbi:MAG: glycoside hydrolase family 3 C-terminal domain-containing protein, partial [Promethearchaeota archaeon]